MTMILLLGDIMLMLDLGAGLKGASRAMKERGWTVITLDIDPKFQCDITADVKTWNPLDIWTLTYENTIDLLWFSMPCDEFSREFMPWSKTGNPPDLSLIKACLNIKGVLNPRYWVCENVKGAIRYLNPIMGRYKASFGPFFLWGNFPDPGKINLYSFRKKESYSSSVPEKRAEMPLAISKSIAIAIESQTSFFCGEKLYDQTNYLENPTR